MSHSGSNVTGNETIEQCINDLNDMSKKSEELFEVLSKDRHEGKTYLYCHQEVLGHLSLIKLHVLFSLVKKNSNKRNCIYNCNGNAKFATLKPI